MEKVKVNIPKKENVEIPFGGVLVSVSPVIRLIEQQQLLSAYLESYFKDGMDETWHEYFAEFMFRRELLNLKTNIEVYEIKNLDELDELVWGSFYDKVKSSIVNYSEVRLTINSTVANTVKKFELEKSFAVGLSSIFDKIKSVVDNFSNMKEEDFEKFKKTANDLIEKMKQEPMASVIADNNGNKKKKSKKEKEYVQ